MLRVDAPASVNGLRISWTPDARALIVPKTLQPDDNSKELWLVPIDGGDARKLNIDTANWDKGPGFSLSPDGRHIAFVGSAGRPGPGYEVWALNNYLTTLTAKK